MFSLISDAHAQDVAAAAGQPGGFMSLLPLLLIFLVMYFLMIRPQQKRMKAHQEMINAVKRNDTVVTGGGIIGKVTDINDEKAIVTVEVADGVELKVNRSTLSEVLDKEAAKGILKNNTAESAKKPAAKKKTTSKRLRS